MDTERCKGCSICIPSCPNDVLALAVQVNGKGYNYCQMVKPDDCIGCMNCAIMCPDSVITVYRQKFE